MRPHRGSGPARCRGASGRCCSPSGSRRRQRGSRRSSSWSSGPRDRGPLLLPGEEVTNWTHGHATASGLPADEWLDWRHRPAWLPLGQNERRVTALVQAAHELGAYLAAAHPFRDPFGWQFFAEAETDPAAMPHGIEVWNGMFCPSDRAAVAFWDDLLQRLAGGRQRGQ